METVAGRLPHHLSLVTRTERCTICHIAVELQHALYAVGSTMSPCNCNKHSMRCNLSLNQATSFRTCSTPNQQFVLPLLRFHPATDTLSLPRQTANCCHSPQASQKISISPKSLQQTPRQPPLHLHRINLPFQFPQQPLEKHTLALPI